MQWAAPGRAKTDAMLARLAEHDPDIACLTEVYRGVQPAGGHAIEGGSSWGYPVVPGRRKVILWSKEPWKNVDQVGDAGLPPGRFVAGQTETQVGLLTVIGACIPWSDAHVRTGRRDSSRWQEHAAYLSALGRLLGSIRGPAVLMGDFNQAVPRNRAPRAVYEQLLDALSPRYTVATHGVVEPLGRAAIDHVTHTGELACAAVTGLSNIGDDGEVLSDHFGVVTRLVLAVRPAGADDTRSP